MTCGVSSHLIFSYLLTVLMRTLWLVQLVWSVLIFLVLLRLVGWVWVRWDVWVAFLGIKLGYVRLKILKVRSTNISFFWNMLLCSPVETYSYFGNTFFLHIPCSWISVFLPSAGKFIWEREAECSSETVINLYQNTRRHIRAVSMLRKLVILGQL